MDPALARERLAGMPWFPRFSLTVGGLGFQRFASGTWGSLPPCVAVLVLVAVLPAGWGWVIDAVLAAMLLWAIVGCELWGAKAEERLGLKDPSCVVLDEIAGMSITLLLLHWPLRSAGEGWGWAVTAVLGVAWAFVTSEEGQRLTEIEKLPGALIEKLDYPDFKPGPLPADVAAQRARSSTLAERAAQPRPDAGKMMSNRATLNNVVDQMSPEEIARAFPGGVVPQGPPPKRNLGGRFRRSGR